MTASAAPDKGMTKLVPVRRSRRHCRSDLLPVVSGFRTQRCGGQRGTQKDDPCSRLDSLEERAQLSPPFLKEVSLLGKGDAFVEVRAGTKVSPEFVIGGAEARRSCKGAKPQHGIIALFDPAMILLDDSCS